MENGMAENPERAFKGNGKIQRSGEDCGFGKAFGPGSCRNLTFKKSLRHDPEEDPRSCGHLLVDLTESHLAD
jgi:hypothetical protein